ncbi:transposase [Shigella flexneri]|uniref:transposase n=1 Tax=Shigella flexneri TaxID=623 RepID=UPI0034CE21F1
MRMPPAGMLRRNRTPSARWPNITACSPAGGGLCFRINRLKALVAKLQRMQFGKSSENFAQNRTTDTGSTGANQRTSGRNGGNAG